MRRHHTLVTLVVFVVLGSALPAWGHATLDQGTVPPSSEQGLTLRVPVEPGEHGGAQPDLATRHNVRVTVEIPKGFTALRCDPKPGWACAVNPAAGRTPHHVAWTREGPPHDAVDVFTFAVRTASKRGEYPFDVNQTYSEGDVSHWDGPKDSSTPAPTLRVE